MEKREKFRWLIVLAVASGAALAETTAIHGQGVGNAVSWSSIEFGVMITSVAPSSEKCTAFAFGNQASFRPVLSS